MAQEAYDRAEKGGAAARVAYVRRVEWLFGRCSQVE
jgi:hypothetical protein